MFFVRPGEWAWDEAPPRVPMFPGDLPRQDHPLPKAPATPPPRNSCAPHRTTSACSCASPSRCCCATGLRVSEYTSLRAGAVVQIGAGPWLHVPVGKLREDRYLPLHPHLVASTTTAPVTSRPQSPAAAPGKRQASRPARRHPLHQQGRRGRRAASHPPAPAQTHLWPPSFNRGMSLEAIAGGSATAALATATAPGRQSWTPRSSRSAKPAPSSRPASSSAPSCKPSTTTPPPSTKTTADSCSPRCSPSNQDAS